MFGDFLRAIEIVRAVGYADRAGGTFDLQYQKAIEDCWRALLEAWEKEVRQFESENQFKIENYMED